MSTPFLGEIKLAAFNFPPKGWAFCNGQLLPISQNQALFSILGTQYGGDGRVNFALPNLQGMVAIHIGNGHVQGEHAGEAAHTLVFGEMPTHNHPMMASTSPATTANPAGAVLADAQNSTGIEQYQGNPDTQMGTAAIAPAGGSQPHENMQPYSVVNFVIALQGLFPTHAQPPTGVGGAR